MQLEVNGKKYRLEVLQLSEPAHPGNVCNGCAFEPSTCAEVHESEACIDESAVENYVWKEMA